jgi:hypothetical protein
MESVIAKLLQDFGQGKMNRLKNHSLRANFKPR